MALFYYTFVSCFVVVVFCFWILNLFLPKGSPWEDLRVSSLGDPIGGFRILWQYLLYLLVGFSLGSLDGWGDNFEDQGAVFFGGR